MRPVGGRSERSDRRADRRRRDQRISVDDAPGRSARICCCRLRVAPLDVPPLRERGGDIDSCSTPCSPELTPLSRAGPPTPAAATNNCARTVASNVRRRAIRCSTARCCSAKDADRPAALALTVLPADEGHDRAPTALRVRDPRRRAGASRSSSARSSSALRRGGRQPTVPRVCWGRATPFYRREVRHRKRLIPWLGHNDGDPTDEPAKEPSDAGASRLTAGLPGPACARTVLDDRRRRAHDALAPTTARQCSRSPPDVATAPVGRAAPRRLLLRRRRRAMFGLNLVVANGARWVRLRAGRLWCAGGLGIGRRRARCSPGHRRSSRCQLDRRIPAVSTASPFPA